MIDDSLSRRILIYASVTGGLGVLAGAFGAHFLPILLEQIYGDAEAADPAMIAKRIDQFDTAVRYQILHAIALLALSGIPFGSPSSRHWVSRCFLAGIILFSGSLYVLVFTGITKVALITPLGGLIWIVGWFLLLFVAQRSTGR